MRTQRTIADRVCIYLVMRDKSSHKSLNLPTHKNNEYASIARIQLYLPVIVMNIIEDTSKNAKNPSRASRWYLKFESRYKIKRFGTNNFSITILLETGLSRLKWKWKIVQTLHTSLMWIENRNRMKSDRISGFVCQNAGLAIKCTFQQFPFYVWICFICTPEQHIRRTCYWLWISFSRSVICIFVVSVGGYMREPPPPPPWNPLLLRLIIITTFSLYERSEMLCCAKFVQKSETILNMCDRKHPEKAHVHYALTMYLVCYIDFMFSV
jgi:hypothetical protein